MGKFPHVLCELSGADCMCDKSVMRMREARDATKPNKNKILPIHHGGIIAFLLSFISERSRGSKENIHVSYVRATPNDSINYTHIFRLPNGVRNYSTHW